MFPRFVQLFLNNKETIVVSFLSKKIFANMKRQADDFSRNITPLFDTMMVQVSTAVGEDSDHSADLNQTPINAQSSTSSQPQKKLKPRRRQRKEIEDHVPTSSNGPLRS
ncbi:hypothetical protein Tco_0403055, partial [Tanacetum coccineum]